MLGAIDRELPAAPARGGRRAATAPAAVGDRRRDAGAQPVLRRRARRPREPAAARRAGAGGAGRARGRCPERARMRRARAARLDPESVQLYYQIALQGRRGPAARARRARRLPDDAAAHARVPARGRRRRSLPVAEKASAAAAKPAQPKAPPLRPRCAAPHAAPAASAAGRSSPRSCSWRARRASWRATPSCAAARATCSTWWCRSRRRILAERAHADKLKAALEQHLGGAVARQRVGRRDLRGATAAALEAASATRGAREAVEGGAGRRLRAGPGQHVRRQGRRLHRSGQTANRGEQA